MVSLAHPGLRLRAFRKARNVSLREASRQLHVAHPTLKDWENGAQVPSPPYRDAIEVWTQEEIRAREWPVSPRERDVAGRAGAVRPFKRDVESNDDHISDPSSKPAA